MCGPLNITVVNGYRNQDSHAVSWCILLFFLYLKVSEEIFFFKAKQEVHHSVVVGLS